MQQIALRRILQIIILDGEEVGLDEKPLAVQQQRLDPYHYYFEIRKIDCKDVDDTVSTNHFFTLLDRDDKLIPVILNLSIFTHKCTHSYKTLNMAKVTKIEII